MSTSYLVETPPLDLGFESYYVTMSDPVSRALIRDNLVEAKLYVELMAGYYPGEIQYIAPPVDGGWHEEHCAEEAQW